jgi:acyl-CoA thioesterase-1
MNNLGRYAKPLLALELAAGCSPNPNRQAVAGERSGAASIGQASAPEQPREQLVLAFGDSLYAGYGMRVEQSFPAALERELDGRGLRTRVVNAGISGDTTAGGRARLKATLARQPAAPDLVVLGLGANDALRGVPPAETRRNLEAMLAELHARGIPVLLTGLTAPVGMESPYFGEYEAIYPALARRYGAALEPSLLHGVLTRREYLLADGVHPNPRGAQRMAERVAPLAANALK